MSDLTWNSLPLEEDEQPRVSLEDLREMARELDPDDFDEAVLNFLDELMSCDDVALLRQAATMLLQDEIDLAPELAAMGVEPEMALIELLLACGADTEARNAYGESPLHLAARYGYVEIVEMLLAAGAGIRRRNERGQLPADVAATPELIARLTPPPAPGEEEDIPLPPEIEDADWEPGEHECCCGHEHGEECHCGHEHHEGHDCHCGHHHGDEGHGGSCGHHH